MVTPDLTTGMKWNVEEAIREAMSRLHTKELIGAVADGRQGFVGLMPIVAIVEDEIRACKKERLEAQAISQVQQGCWSC